jgi:hypothetical protein
MVEENQVAQEQPVPVSEPTEINWRDQLPEDLKNDPSMKTIVDIPGLAKSFVNAQKFIGADKIAVPTEHATPEDIKQFSEQVYSKMGRPSSAEEYVIEGEASDMITSFKPLAHELGLNNEQVSALVGFYNEAQEQAQTNSGVDIETQRSETEALLRKEYGKAYDSKLNSAMRLAQNVFTQEQLDGITLADGSSLGNNPDLIKGFVKLASMVGEDQPINAPQENVFTPDEAQRKIDQHMVPGSPYWDKSHPNHDRAVQDVFELRQMMYPDEE